VFNHQLSIFQNLTVKSSAQNLPKLSTAFEIFFSRTLA
jgi:hypothetical protein